MSTHILECVESGHGWGMVPGTAQIPSGLGLVGGQFCCPPDGVVEVFPSVAWH